MEDFIEKTQINPQINRSKFTYLENLVSGDYTNNKYGNPKAQSFDDIKNHSKYLGRDTYVKHRKNIYSQFRNFKGLGQTQIVEEKKLAFNDLGLGVFCFPRAAVALRKHRRLDDTIKIVSDVRDVYAYFPHTESEKKIITLYQYSGALGDIKASEMLYNGIIIGVLVELLIQQGIDLEVYVIINTHSNGVCCGTVTKVKSVNEDIDIEDLMLMCADPRFYRYKGFLSHISAFDYFNKKIALGWGYSTTAIPYSKKLIEKTTKTDGLPIIINRCYSEKAVIDEVNRVLGIVKNSQ